jgi:hypothetical protein
MMKIGTDSLRQNLGPCKPPLLRCTRLRLFLLLPGIHPGKGRRIGRSGSIADRLDSCGITELDGKHHNFYKMLRVRRIQRQINEARKTRFCRRYTTLYRGTREPPHPGRNLKKGCPISDCMRLSGPEGQKTTSSLTVAPGVACSFVSVGFHARGKNPLDVSHSSSCDAVCGLESATPYSDVATS